MESINITAPVVLSAGLSDEEVGQPVIGEDHKLVMAQSSGANSALGQEQTSGQDRTKIPCLTCLNHLGGGVPAEDGQPVHGPD